MTEANFFQSWAFWFLVGIVIGFVAGFLLAAILAASSKASRMEETLTLKSKDMPPWKISTPFDDKKDTYGIVTKNDPRTD